MRYQVGCVLEYDVPHPSTFVFNVAAAATEDQWIEDENLTISPEMPLEQFTSPTTRNRYHRLAMDRGPLRLKYQATIETADDRGDPSTAVAARPDTLPLWTLPYILPSRYCQSDKLMRLAYREFGRFTPGYAQVQAICDWIFRNVDYLVGTTNPLTSAFDTATARAGVCRDFAHLGIAFCRAVNIPARFISGYAYELNPPDFHAMFEAWIGDRWHLFDPTRQIPPKNLVRIGVGRDAADVSFALIFGPAVMTNMTVYARLAEVEVATEHYAASSA